MPITKNIIESMNKVRFLLEKKMNAEIKKQKKQNPDCPGSPNKNIPPKQNYENID